MKVITARYPGRCAGCHQPIAPGDTIRHHGRGESYHEGCPTNSAGGTARSATLYRGTGRRYSHGFSGRCTHEDYPCCGCCS